VAPDGQPPAAPFQCRPKPAALSGLVTEKATGKPVPFAKVSFVPVAGRKGDESGLPKAVCDAQGKFRFDRLPEGPAFVMAQVVVEKGVAGIREIASVARVDLKGGESATADLALGAAPLVAGKVVDQTGQLLRGYKAILVGPRSDGQVLSPELNAIYPDTEFRFVALEGPGKYSILVEKPGMLARTKAGRTVDVPGDRITFGLVGAEVVPSATVKGRVLDADSGKPIADERAGAAYDAADPPLPRTVVTLRLPNGFVQSVVADADGSFAFNTNLDAGNYDLSAERFGFRPQTRRFALAAGQTATVDLSLKSALPTALKLKP
jgi:hypothetical protein